MNNTKTLKALYLLLFLTILVNLSSCDCDHEWDNATCTSPTTCRLCSETAGEAIGHTWSDATCTNPATCYICGEKEGESIGHNWTDATCTSPTTCRLCGETKGTRKDHDYVLGTCFYCGIEDPSYFVPENYGFINNYGMYTFVEITGYSLSGTTPYVFFEEHGYSHKIRMFKDKIYYDYSRYETDENVDNKKLTEDLNGTESYTIINNDAISVDGDTFTIFERVCRDGRLILKTMWNNTERWYILEEQIDWNKSPSIENVENGWKKYTYYFK